MAPRILVVDDDPVIRQLVTDLLTDEGYQVQTAGDGQAALDRITWDPPDLIISDIMMPRCDGLLLLQTLRLSGVAIPVVLMSATHLASGVIGAPLIPKPFEFDAVLAQVTRLLTITRR